MKNPQPTSILIECFETKLLTPKDQNVYLTCDVTEALPISHSSTTCFLEGRPTRRSLVYKCALDWPAPNERTCNYLRNKIGDKDVILTITTTPNCATDLAYVDYKSSLQEQQSVKVTVSYLLDIWENKTQDGVFRIQDSGLAIKEEITEDNEESILWPSEAFEFSEYYENVRCVVVRKRRYIILPPLDLDSVHERGVNESECSNANAKNYGEFMKLPPGLQHHLPEIHGVGVITFMVLTLHEWPVLISDYLMTVTSDTTLETPIASQSSHADFLPSCIPTSQLSDSMAIDVLSDSHVDVVPTSEQDLILQESSCVNVIKTLLEVPHSTEAKVFDSPSSPKAIFLDVDASCTYSVNSSFSTPEFSLPSSPHFLVEEPHFNSSHATQNTCTDTSSSDHDESVGALLLYDTATEDNPSSPDVPLKPSNSQLLTKTNSQTISSTNKFGCMEFASEGQDDLKDTTNFSLWKQKLDDKADILVTTADRLELLQYEMQEYMQQLGVEEDRQCEASIPSELYIKPVHTQSMSQKSKHKLGNIRAKSKHQIETSAFCQFCAEQKQTLLESFPHLDNDKVSQLLVKRWNAMNQKEKEAYEPNSMNKLNRVQNKHAKSKQSEDDLRLSLKLKATKRRIQTKEVAFCEGLSQNRNHSNNQNATLQKQMGQEIMWVQCSKCNKWRKLPRTVNSRKKWVCTLNPDPKYNSCEAKEELTEKWHRHISTDSNSEEQFKLTQTAINEVQAEKPNIGCKSTYDAMVETDSDKRANLLHEDMEPKDQALRLDLKRKKKHAVYHDVERRLIKNRKMVVNNRRNTTLNQKKNKLKRLVNSSSVVAKHCHVLNEGSLNVTRVEERIPTLFPSAMPKIRIKNKASKSRDVKLALADTSEDVSPKPNVSVINTVREKQSCNMIDGVCASLSAGDCGDLEATSDVDQWRNQLEERIGEMHTIFKQSVNAKEVPTQPANVTESVCKQQDYLLQGQKMLKVQCNKCNKWRNIPAAVYMDISERWMCCVDYKGQDAKRIDDTQASSKTKSKKRLRRPETKLQQLRKKLTKTMFRKRYPHRKLLVAEADELYSKNKDLKPLTFTNHQHVDVQLPDSPSCSNRACKMIDETGVNTEHQDQTDDVLSDRTAVSVNGLKQIVKSSNHVKDCKSGKRKEFGKSELKRPMNAFMKFSAQFRPLVAETNLNYDNKGVSKLLGKMWRKMTAEEKEPYVIAFREDLERMRSAHPNWKYRSSGRLSDTELSVTIDNRLRTRKLAQFMNYRECFGRSCTKQQKRSTEGKPNLSQSDTWQNLEESWVQCDDCSKWRRLPSTVDARNLPKRWSCSLNPDVEYNRCEDEEEVVNDQWNWHVFAISDAESTEDAEGEKSDDCLSAAKLADEVGCDQGTLHAEDGDATLSHFTEWQHTGRRNKPLPKPVKTCNRTSNPTKWRKVKKRKERKHPSNVEAVILESNDSQCRLKKLQSRPAKKMTAQSSLAMVSREMITSSYQNSKEITPETPHPPTTQAEGLLNSSGGPRNVVIDELKELEHSHACTHQSDAMANAELLRLLDISIKERRKKEKMRFCKKLKSRVRLKEVSKSPIKCRTSSHNAKTRAKRRQAIQNGKDITIEEKINFKGFENHSCCVQHINQENDVRSNKGLVSLDQQNVACVKFANVNRKTDSVTPVRKEKSKHKYLKAEDLFCHELLPEFSDDDSQKDFSHFNQEGSSGEQHVTASNNSKQLMHTSKEQDLSGHTKLALFSENHQTDDYFHLKQRLYNNDKQVSGDSERLKLASKQTAHDSTSQVDNKRKPQEGNSTTPVVIGSALLNSITNQNVESFNITSNNIVLKTSDFRELLRCALRNKKLIGNGTKGSNLSAKICGGVEPRILHVPCSNRKSTPHLNNVECTKLVDQQTITDKEEQTQLNVCHQSLEAKVNGKLKSILNKLEPSRSEKKLSVKLKPSNTGLLESRDQLISCFNDHSGMLTDNTTSPNQKESNIKTCEAAECGDAFYPKKEGEIVKIADGQVSTDVSRTSYKLKSTNTKPVCQARFKILLTQFYEQLRRRKCAKCSKYVKVPESVVIKHLPQTWICNMCEEVDDSSTCSVINPINVSEPRLKETVLTLGMTSDSTIQPSSESDVCNHTNNLVACEEEVGSIAETTCRCPNEQKVLRKKKRVKNNDPTKLRRPMNAFIKFSNEYRDMVSSFYQNSDNREVSMLLGRLWKQLIPEEKEPYIAAFKRDLNKLRAEHPDWNYASKKQVADTEVMVEKRLRIRKIEQFINYRDYYRRPYTKRKLTESTDSQNYEPELQNQESLMCSLNESQRSTEDVWVQCDECNKWRKLPSSVDSSYPLPEKWMCHLNPDPQRNCCDADEEEY